MLISQRQHAANLLNALRSTGPNTTEGKAAVRLNALRYGLRARSLLLPGEDPAEFERLFAGLEADWRPQNQTERLLVEQMAVAQWKLARLETGESSLLEQTMTAEKQLALLDRFSVQRARLERSFSKAAHDLEHFRKTRPAKPEQPAVREHNPAPRPLPPAPGGQRPPVPLVMQLPAQTNLAVAT
jgi:hypothetical protein